MKHTINALCAVFLILAGLTSCGSLTPRVTKQIEMADPCTVLVFHSRAIARGKLPTNDLGKACVSLPASYASSPDRRYPVVYALNGFGDGALAMLRAIRGVTAEHPQDADEFILVAIDGGTSFYANSPASGYWEDMITREAIALIDSRYRTIASPEGRMLAGFSMGGFGAWNIALAHPDIYCAAWSCCPGAWDENGLRDTLRGWDSGYRNAYGAAYAPDLSLPPPYARIPKFDGTPEDNEVAAAWERGFGGVNGKLDAYARRDARLKGVGFAYGSYDGFPWIPRGTRYVANAMSAAGIPVTIREYQSGHDMTNAMIQESLLPFIRAIFSGTEAGYADGVYTEESRDRYTAEPYWGQATITVRDGTVQNLDFQIIDKQTNTVFDKTYERHFAGNQTYIDQCRNDLRGLEGYIRAFNAHKNLERVDAVTGATWSYNIFKAAVSKALDTAKKS